MAQEAGARMRVGATCVRAAIAIDRRLCAIDRSAVWRVHGQLRRTIDEREFDSVSQVNLRPVAEKSTPLRDKNTFTSPAKSGPLLADEHVISALALTVSPGVCAT
eukprot:7310163-Prymnesium_polylepis.1